MKNILYIIALITIVTFSSCTSETSYYDTLNEEQAAFLFTGQLFGTGGIQDLLGPAYSKLTDELRMPVNTGSNPPNLNGNYPLFEQETIANIFDPNVVPWISDNRFIHINLINQDNSNLTIDYQGFFMDAGADGQPLGGDDSVVLTEAREGQVYVSGDSTTGAFTIFARALVDGGPTVDIIAISGIRTATGVDNLQYAYVTYDNGDPDTGTIIDGNTFRDADMVSNSFVWP